MVTTEYNAKGPALPIRFNCTMVEESIFGFLIPGWDTGNGMSGNEMVPFSDLGGLVVRSYGIIYVSKAVSEKVSKK